MRIDMSQFDEIIQHVLLDVGVIGLRNVFPVLQKYHHLQSDLFKLGLYPTRV